MKAHKKMLGVAVASALAAGVVTAATASADRHQGEGRGHQRSVTGFPDRLNTFDLNGYQIVTSYPLGTNTGSTFQQNYTDTSVQAFAVGGPFVTNPPTFFNSTYTALPVGDDELMVAWFNPQGWSSDIFLFNFKDGLVSDVAPAGTPGVMPESLGTLKIIKYGPDPLP